MELKYLIITGVALFCLIASFAALYFINLHSGLRDSPRGGIYPAAAGTLIFSVGSLALVWLFPDFSDFISAAGFNSLVAPLVAVAILSVVYAFSPSPKFSAIALVAFAALIVFFSPASLLAFSNNLPLWANQLLTLLLWLFIAFGLRILNGLDGLVPIELIAVGCGLFIIALIGGTPLLIGFSALCLTAVAVALLLYNSYPAQLKISNGGTELLGFVLGWLIITASAEGAAPSAFILALFPLYEITVALLKRITFLPRYRDIIANTAYYQISLSGLNPAFISSYIGKFNLVLVIFACFQIFAPNTYSLPILCILVTAWNLHRLSNWDTASGSLKDINRRFVKDFKNGIADIKKNLNKD